MKDEMIPACPADGKQYAVPFNGYWEGMYVNKSVCEQAGVEVPGANTTWDEFLEICQRCIRDRLYAGGADKHVRYYGWPDTPIWKSAGLPHPYFWGCYYNWKD